MFNPNYIDEWTKFFPKLFCKIIFGTCSFHKWKYFLIWVGEVIFLDLSKISMNFVPKMITQNIFKIRKKFLNHEKVQNVSFQTIQDFPLSLKERQRYGHFCAINELSKIYLFYIIDCFSILWVIFTSISSSLLLFVFSKFFYFWKVWLK